MVAKRLFPLLVVTWSEWRRPVAAERGLIALLGGVVDELSERRIPIAASFQEHSLPEIVGQSVDVQTCALTHDCVGVIRFPRLWKQFRFDAARGHGRLC
ncbi:hypothetical protein ACWIGW_45990 [Nocardia brasiliensis]